MQPADRLKKVLPYPFAELDAIKAKAIKEGRDLIDLSIGDPDLDPPKAMLDELKARLDDRGIHRYPPYIATETFRKAASNWLSKRHGARVDWKDELTGLIGAKEGLAHFMFSVVNEGDHVVFPSPHYPVYEGSTHLCGGVPNTIPLSADDDFVPDLNYISDDVWNKTKVLIINFPHNPTSATVDKNFLKGVIQKAEKFSFIVCSDAAYLDICDGEPSPSLLSVPGGKEVGIEFHSISKLFSAAGWRLGYAAGNSKLIGTLRRLKTAVDSGQFMPLDMAASYMLEHGEKESREICSVYSRRRKILKAALDELGFEVFAKPATLYVWAKVKGAMTSADFAKHLLQEFDVIVTPGTAFGSAGEGFIRFSLTLPDSRIEEAAKRLAGL